MKEKIEMHCLSFFFNTDVQKLIFLQIPLVNPLITRLGIMLLLIIFSLAAEQVVDPMR